MSILVKKIPKYLDFTFSVAKLIPISYCQTGILLDRGFGSITLGCNSYAPPVKLIELVKYTQYIFKQKGKWFSSLNLSLSSSLFLSLPYPLCHHHSKKKESGVEATFCTSWQSWEINIPPYMSVLQISTVDSSTTAQTFLFHVSLRSL